MSLSQRPSRSSLDLSLEWELNSDMLRTPTPASYLYAWHREALAGGNPIAIHDEPQCGWFETKLVKHGLMVPVRIWMDQPTDPETGELCDDERLCAEVDGEPRDDIEDLWNYVCGRPVSRETFDFMEAKRVWALYHSPSDPAANTRRRLDPLFTPIHF